MSEEIITRCDVCDKIVDSSKEGLQCVYHALTVKEAYVAEFGTQRRIIEQHAVCLCRFCYANFVKLIQNGIKESLKV